MNTNKIYISGKITGLPMLEVVEKFARVQVRLHSQGCKHVVNPLLLDHANNHNKDYDTYMKTDIKAMMDCNTIYMLPCWKDSKGAKIELQLAIQLNYHIIWGD